MGINQIFYGDRELINLREDTVDAEHLVNGYTAHDRHGEPITGTNMFDCNSSDATATAEQITNGYIAYVKGERIIGTNQNDSNTTDATATAADIALDKTAYVMGSKVAGTNILETEIKAEDVKDGVKIYKTSTDKEDADGTPLLTGTYTSDGTITADRVVEGDIGYAKGEQVVGTAHNYGAVNKTITTKDQLITLESGFYSQSTVKIDSNAVRNATPENIRMGRDILGVIGTLDARLPVVDRVSLPGGGIHVIVEKEFYEFETDFTNIWYAVFELPLSVPQEPIDDWISFVKQNGLVCYAKSEDAELYNVSLPITGESGGRITNFVTAKLPDNAIVGVEIVAKWPESVPEPYEGWDGYVDPEAEIPYVTPTINTITSDIVYAGPNSSSTRKDIAVSLGETTRYKDNYIYTIPGINESDSASVIGFRYNSWIKPEMLKIAVFKTNDY